MEDKRKAVYSITANFPTVEEARENTKNIAGSLLLGSRQVVMFINHALSNPKIKEELLATGFIEKHLPGWIGSKADTIDKNTKKTKNTTDKITIEPMNSSP